MNMTDDRDGRSGVLVWLHMIQTLSPNSQFSSIPNIVFARSGKDIFESVTTHIFKHCSTWMRQKQSIKVPRGVLCSPSLYDCKVALLKGDNTEVKVFYTWSNKPWIVCCGQTTGNIWAPKYYIFPINDLPHRPPKKNQKISEKNPSKGHPSARTLLEFKEKNSRSVFHNMQITSEPHCSDPCARLKIQIPMHSISWGCLKIVRHCDSISLLINTFGIHLDPGYKSYEQIIDYRAEKNVQIQAIVFLYF